MAALKSAGRKDEAKAVEKIPRPSLAVWTVNQIARRDPELVRRLVAITERLKSSAGAEYGAAAAELRQVLEDLRGEAAAVLAAAGHEDLGPHLVQRVIANLRAAAGNAARNGRALRWQRGGWRATSRSRTWPACSAPRGRCRSAGRPRTGERPRHTRRPTETKTQGVGRRGEGARTRARQGRSPPPNARSSACATPPRPRARTPSAPSAPSRPRRESLAAAEKRLAADQADARRRRARARPGRSGARAPVRVVTRDLERR